MRIYSDKLVQKARRLREENFSYREISNILNIPDATIRKWCFNIKGGKGQSLREIRRNKETRNKFLKEGKDFVRKLDVGNFGSNQARLLASFLY